MKKILGSLLCLVAAFAIAGRFISPQKETQMQQIQDWALILVMMFAGIALSAGKKTPK